MTTDDSRSLSPSPGWPSPTDETLTLGGRGVQTGWPPKSIETVVVASAPPSVVSRETSVAAANIAEASRESTGGHVSDEESVSRETGLRPDVHAEGESADESLRRIRQTLRDVDLTAAAPQLADADEDAVLSADQEPPSPAEQSIRTGAGHGSEPFPRPGRCRVICIANQKGGVGKTTTAVNVAAALALHGGRVLLIDLDPQGNASTGLGVNHQAGVPSIYDVLLDGAALAEVAAPVDGVRGLACVPATIDLAGAEIELVSVVARESRLKRAIAAHSAALDYILIDCPPSLGLLTVNALVAATELFIPIQCEYYALEGLSQLLRNVDLIRAHLNADLAVSTILLTMYDGRTRLADQVAAEVREHFGEVVLTAQVPRSVRVSEAPGYGQSVMTYDPVSRGALSYLNVARELAARGAPD